MGRWRGILAVALAAATASCGTPTLTPTPTPLPGSPSSPPAVPSSPISSVDAGAAGATLEIKATGVGGPCDVSFPYACVFVIEIDGPGGVHHEGWLDYDPASASPDPSHGVGGDVPAALGPGTWTLTFTYQHRGDTMSFRPVPGGTPRAVHEGTVIGGCATTIDATGAIAVTIDVAFTKPSCAASATITVS